MRAPRSIVLLLFGASTLVLLAGNAGGETAGDDSEMDQVSGASACTRGEHEGQSPEAMMSQFFDELGLTSQQQTDIQIITSDYAERLRDLARLARQSAEALLTLAPDDPAYRTKTDEASALAATNAAEVVILLAEMRGKLYAVLTAEQRQALQDKLAEQRRQFEEKHQQYQQQRDDGAHDRPLEEFIG